MADTKKVTLTSVKTEVQTWIDTNANIVMEFHKEISQLWTANKDRNLATVESAVRGILADIGRLSESIPKLGTGEVAKNSNPYAVSKPR